MAGSDIRARSLTTDPGGRLIDSTTGVHMGGLGDHQRKVSVLPLKGELPTCFEGKARILDFYPVTLDEDCLLRVCGDCKNM